MRAAMFTALPNTWNLGCNFPSTPHVMSPSWIPTRISRKSGRSPCLFRGGRTLRASLIMSCVAVCCSVLQCVAVCCSVLQCVVPCVLQCVLQCDHVLCFTLCASLIMFCWNFSKVSSVVIWYGKLSSAPTFEKFYLRDGKWSTRAHESCYVLALKANGSISVPFAKPLKHMGLCCVCCATWQGSLDWYEVHLSARPASFRVICVLSELNYLWCFSPTFL